MYGNSHGGRMLGNTQPRFKAPKTKKKKDADVAGIFQEDYGKYWIKAGRLSGAYIARAFPKPPAKAQGVIAEAKGVSEKAAIVALKAMIEARNVQRTAARRWEERSSISVPNEEEFVEALRQAKLSSAQVAMLKALSIAAEDGLTYSRLANAAGYKSNDTAAKVLTRAGTLIADYLAIEIADCGASNNEGAVCVLGIRNTSGEDVPPVWIMHEELRDAVRLVL